MSCPYEVPKRTSHPSCVFIPSNNSSIRWFHLLKHADFQLAVLICMKMARKGRSMGTGSRELSWVRPGSGAVISVLVHWSDSIRGVKNVV